MHYIQESNKEVIHFLSKRNGFTFNKKWRIAKDWSPCLRSSVLCQMLSKIFSTKRKRVKWEVLFSSLSSTLIIIWPASHKIYSQTKFLLRCKYPAQINRWFVKPDKNSKTWLIIKKANAHWRKCNQNPMPFSSSWRKRNNCLNWALTLTYTNLELTESWKTMLLNFWKKSGMNSSLMSLFSKQESIPNFKSTSWNYFRVICDFRDCFWQIDESNKKLDFLLRQLRDKIKPEYVVKFILEK